MTNVTTLVLYQTSGKRALCASVWWVLALAAADTTRATGPVTITGGRQESAQWYEWTVMNQSDVAVVGIEFAHYMADLFQAPPGWATEGTTNLQNIGVRSRWGVCRASYDPHAEVDPRTGIYPGPIRRGAPGRFALRVAREGARVGKGTMTVRFEDGSSAQIAGAEMPVGPPWFEPYLVPAGIGLLLLLAIGARHLRARRAQGQGAAAQSSHDAGP
jgi:hypothetical protein